MYNFYFDESSHTRAISFQYNKGVNIFNDITDKVNDLFIGVFIGVKDEHHFEIEHQFLNIENHIKNVLGLNIEQEFKGETIKTNKFKHGFNSVHKTLIPFYKNFLDFLDNDKVIIHMHMFSKTEFMLTSYFQNIGFDNRVNINKGTFIYTIIKFLFHYRKIDLLQKMFDSENNISEEFLESLKWELIQIIAKAKTIKRMEREIHAFEQLLEALYFANITVNPMRKYKWDYTELFEGFDLLLKELNIYNSQVLLQLDPEGTNEIINLAKLQGFKSAESNLESDKCSMIRIADVFSNLLFKFSYNLYESLKEEAYTGVSNRDFTSKRLVDKQWFDIKREEVFLLYVQFYKVLEKRKDIYWTAYSGIYMDYTVITFAIISYIGNEFKSFEDFNSFDAIQHQENFNNYICMQLEERYKRLYLSFSI